ncbi:MAG: LSU ribosomal protein L4P [Candidatus Magasanikbacteria bacterium]|nr:LSU ribosomal protein L4P [Candidatus Magasanikbacteria bacterium]
MKTKLYNLAGQTIGEVELSDRVFGAIIKPGVVHEVVTAAAGNARQGTAHTKTRGEVKGGGKKPWAQKGTGRARHGSIRSPIWKGGGVVWGPRNAENYKRKINHGLAKVALRMVMTDKAKTERLIVVDDLKPVELKTKWFSKVRAALPGSGRKTLVLTPVLDRGLVRIVKNIPKITAEEARNADILSLINNDYVILSVEAVKALEKRLS